MNELMVVVSGLVEVRRPSEWAGKYDSQESIMNEEGRSVYLGSRCLTSGLASQVLGHMAQVSVFLPPGHASKGLWSR